MESDRQFRARMAALESPALRGVSVVVPAHNEQNRLARCLASIAEAARRVEVPVRVMVVLDACTDRSEEAISGPVDVLRVSFRNVGTARAAGFAATSTADPAIWLATTDADCVVPTGWLTHQIAHHADSFQGVLGTVSVDWREHSPATQRSYERLYRFDAASHGHVHGANLGVRADAYWRVGGFRPLSLGEDVDLVDRLIAAGTPIAWDPDNPVLTSDRRVGRAAGGFADFVKSLAVDALSPEADIA